MAVGELGKRRLRRAGRQLVASGVVTVPLALLAMLLTTALAFVFGLYAASHHGRAGDSSVMARASSESRFRTSVFAILLILVFAVKLRWFSAGGFPGCSADDVRRVGAGLRALVLPAVALAVVHGGDPGPDRPLGGARRAARGLRPDRARPRASRRAACSGPRAEDAMVPVLP